MLVGLTAALMMSRYLESALFGVSATDPTTLIAAALILMATVLVACYVPARRATKVDPTQTLRYE